jgi:D-alanyl-D-alanine carboxypeptidase
MLTRRSFLRFSLAAPAWLGLCGVCASAWTDESAADEPVKRYMAAYDVPALSLCYGRGKQILFVKGYGLADRHGREPLTPESLFRIASLSKPFTSAAIFRLVESGKLRTDDRVFGSGGILKSFALHERADWLQAITVRDLLTHTSGGWSNKEHDPMFHDRERSPADFLQHTLDADPLEYAPGTHYAYSNFGYFVLGRVIEHVSGMPYGDCVQQQVLAPLGITDMRLAQKKAAANEVHYYGQGHDDPYSLPIELHDANGGWIATPSDLVHFALGVFSAEDNAGAPALLKPEILQQMTRGSAANREYACGWRVSPEGDYSHSGGFDGASSFLVHRRDGLTWAVLVNTRRTHSDMEEDLHRLSRDIAASLAA